MRERPPVTEPENRTPAFLESHPLLSSVIEPLRNIGLGIKRTAIILGIVAGGIGLGYLLGEALNLPVWGQVLTSIAGVGFAAGLCASSRDIKDDYPTNLSLG